MVQRKEEMHLFWRNTKSLLYGTLLDYIFFSEALLGKEHKEQQVNYDVKIGDGMDIAIHGENGKIIFESLSKVRLKNLVNLNWGTFKGSQYSGVEKEDTRHCPNYIFMQIVYRTTTRRPCRI